MSCTSCQAKLSAYLDGELGDGEASALRGHLRTCAGCSAAAEREAQVIDGLRQLASMEPPPAMWQAIRAQLADREIADAEAPLRARLWRRLMPLAPRAWRGLGGVALATAAVLVLWSVRSSPPPGGSGIERASSRPPAAAQQDPAGGSALVSAGVVVGAATPSDAPIDVAIALGDEVAMIDRAYRDAVSELVAMIGEERAGWTPGYARRYDERVRELRARVDSEPTGRIKERAWQELTRYLQTTLTRAELASGAPMGAQ
jgi:anti-sigma factor RsiW